MNNFVGRQLGNYRLIRLLGQGGFADVYLGEHVYLKTLAAIKLLQARLASNDLETFLKEARAISSLIHPNIVRVLEFGVEGGTTPFLVMDYAPNGTLRQRHPEGTRLAPATIIPYVRQVGAALQYAHDRKIIHRDIKPENMLLGQNNDVLLSDFGIAVVTQSSRYSSTQDVVGTIGYMAPEQLNGKLMPASDQYSLAVIVYEWLSGERPFRGSFPEVASQHLLAAPALLHEKIPGITPAINEVVQRGLAKNPEQRFMRIEAFANALEQACQEVRAGQFTPPVPGMPPALPAKPSSIPPAQGGIIWNAPMNQPSSPHPSGSFAAQPQGQGWNAPMGGQPPSPNYGQLPPQQPQPLQQPQAPNWGAVPGPQSSPNYGGQPPFQPQSASQNFPGAYGAAPNDPTFVVNRQVPPFQNAAMNPAGGPPPSPGMYPPPGGSQPPKKGVSRRTVIIGLAGVAGLVVVGGVGLALSQHHGTGTALTPTATGTNPAANNTTPTATSTTAPTASPTDSNPGQTPTSSSGAPPIPGVVSYIGHTRYITAVAWSPDGTMIASASGDNTVQVWDPTTGNNIYTYSGHKNPVNAVVWSRDSKYIFSASDDVQVWQATNGTRAFSYVGHNATVRCLALSPDGTRMASGSDDSTIQIWNASSPTRFSTHQANAGVRALAWSPDGRRIASTRNDLVDVWDPNTGNTINTYTGHSGNNVNAIAWSHDGKHVASGSDDKTVQVWDAVSLSPSYTYQGHAQPVDAAEWSPDDARVASGSADKTVQVWNSANGSNRYVYPNHTSQVNAVMWSPNGTHIASGSGDPNTSDGSDDHTVQVWQPA